MHWYITSDSERVCWGSSQPSHVWGREHSPHFVDEAEWLAFPWRRRKSPDFSSPDPHSHLPTWKNTHPTHNIPSLPPPKGTGKQPARDEILRAHPGFAGPESERSRNRTQVSPMTAPRVHGRLGLKGSSSPPTGMTAGKAHSLTHYCCLVSVKHLLCARFWESKTALEQQSIWVGPTSALFSIIILYWFPL